MTTSGDFKTIVNPETDEKPNQTAIFGIPMTPTIMGILLGLLGLGAAMYIWNTFVNPVLETKKQLVQDKEQKEIQLKQLQSGELQNKITALGEELQREQQLESIVFSMFSDEKTLDTLLLDVNKIVNLWPAELVTYLPQSPESEVITDGSLGQLVNERLTRKRNDVVIVGTFEETQSIIEEIERLQPLLLFKNFETTISEPPKYIYQQGKIDIQGETRLTTSFTLDAIMPRNPADIPQPEAAAEEGTEEQSAEDKKQ